MRIPRDFFLPREFFILLAAILIAGCQQARLNPLDPVGTAFVKPGLTLLNSLPANLTLTTDSISLAWKGTSEANQYEYTLTSLATGVIYKESNGWITDTTFSVNHLDDSPYRFMIATRYPGLDTTAQYEFFFNVQTSPTPALVFMRKFCQVPPDSQFEVDVWGEGISGLFAGDLTVGFDPRVLAFNGYAVGALKDTSGVGSQLLTEDYPQPDPNQSGSVQLSTVYASKSTGGNSAVSGTGSIIRLYFKGKATGQCSIVFANADLRDLNGDSIEVDHSRTATVVVK